MDLEYARYLCGDQGIYFKPMCVESLQDAILRLVKKLDSNWQPKWI